MSRSSSTSWPVQPLQRWKLGALIGGAFGLVVVYATLGMPGMDHGASTPAHHESTLPVPLVELDPDGFAVARAAGRESVLINVHVPYEGEIDGTDAFIPYDEILEHGDLPLEREQPILLYCRSGRMSRIAGEALIQSGYTNVSHLTGGMDAWTATGRTVLDQPDPRWGRTSALDLTRQPAYPEIVEHLDVQPGWLVAEPGGGEHGQYDDDRNGKALFRG